MFPTILLDVCHETSRPASASVVRRGLRTLLSQSPSTGQSVTASEHAWVCPDSGHRELECLGRFTGRRRVGDRSLQIDSDSPAGRRCKPAEAPKLPAAQGLFKRLVAAHPRGPQASGPVYEHGKARLRAAWRRMGQRCTATRSLMTRPMTRRRLRVRVKTNCGSGSFADMIMIDRQPAAAAGHPNSVHRVPHEVPQYRVKVRNQRRHAVSVA